MIAQQFNTRAGEEKSKLAEASAEAARLDRQLMALDQGHKGLAETVRTLMGQIAAQQGRPWNRGDVAIAVAFAKRFAY